MLPVSLYPVLKGHLMSPDGSVWSVLESESGEEVTRLDPSRANVGDQAGPAEIAAFELLLLSPN